MTVQEETTTQSVHTGHRQRLKERFLASGLESFSPHEIVEMLLSFAIPQRDLNELAHTLIEHFGSVSGVLEGSYDELTSIEGIGPHAATMLQFVCSLVRYYSLENCEKPYVYDTIDKVGQYLVNFFIGMTIERAYAMLFDNQMHLIDIVHIADSTVNSVQFPARVIVEKAIKRNAAGVILAHNHPHGTASPSPDDFNLTFSLEQTLKTIGITLIDHVIVSGKYFAPVIGARKKSLLSADNPAADLEHFYGHRTFETPIFAASDPIASFSYSDKDLQ